MLRVGLKVKKDGEKFWMFTVAGSLGIAFCRSGFTMTLTGTVANLCERRRLNVDLIALHIQNAELAGPLSQHRHSSIRMGYLPSRM